MLILEKEAKLKNSQLYMEVQNLKKTLADNEALDEKLREEAKDMMLTSGVKEFKMLDGTVIALHKNPGSLVVEDESLVPKMYWKENKTKSIDKKALKSDFDNGVPLDPSIYIQSDYKFVIKSK
jgi:hypothetical protein